MATSLPFARDRAGRFYLGFALVAAGAVGIGFSTTYFLPLARGSFAGPPIAHVHGALFIAWILTLATQVTLVRTGRTRLHRKIGWVALALAPAMAASGIGVAMYAVGRDLAAGAGPAAYSQLIGVVTAMTIFLAFVGTAIARRKRPDWHKRMILLATIAILWPAWFRFRHVLPPFPRPDIWLSVVLSDSLILVAMARDKWKFGRVHPAYWLFGLGLIAEHVAETLCYDAPWWRAAAAGIYGVIGG